MTWAFIGGALFVCGMFIAASMGKAAALGDEREEQRQMALHARRVAEGTNR